MQRIKQLLENVKKEHSDRISDVREQWTGNVGTFSLSAMGFSVSGTIAVTPTEVQLSGDLPFAASFFKSRIEATIRERATELLT
jgi:putative polyhydroxyalkanoic acid system protein